MNTLQTLFHWVLGASLQASFLVVAVLLLQFALRGFISERWRYALWLPVMLVLTLPVLPQSHWSAENVIKIHSQPPVAALLPVEISRAATSPAPAPVTRTAAPGWKENLAIAWAAGMVITFSFGLFSYLAARRRFSIHAVPADDRLVALIDAICRELRMKRSPSVLLSKAAESPAVAGVLSPILLLPADFTTLFSGEEARLVLKHELMHLKRWDLQLNVLLYLLHAMHWFNPVLWLASWRIRQDREAACDAQVLDSDPRDCRSDYGHALLKVQTAYCPQGMSLGFVGIFEHGRGIRSRIVAIARHRRPGLAGSLVAFAAIVLLSVVGATHAHSTKDDGKPTWIEINAQFVELNASVPVNLTSASNVTHQNGATILCDKDFEDFIKVRVAGKDSVLSSPRVTTRNQQKAEEGVGKEFVFEPNGKPVFLGCAFTVTPEIVKEGIKLEFTAEQSAMIDRKTGAELPEIAATSEFRARAELQTRKITNTVIIQEGHTALCFGENRNGRMIAFAITAKKTLAKRSDIQLVNMSLAAPGVASSPKLTAIPNTDMLITKEYAVHSGMGGGKTCFEVLKSAGIPFPAGASAAYYSAAQKLIVRNTEANLHLVDALVATLNAQPQQSTPQPRQKEVKTDRQVVPNPDCEKIQNKLDQILIPKIEFHEATLQVTVDCLNKMSREFDTQEPDPMKKGVNFVLDNALGKNAASSPSPSDPRITLSLTNISLGEALKFITSLAEVKVTISPSAVTLVPLSKN